MIERKLAIRMKELASAYSVLTLVGPRQSGKTTLSKMVFSQHGYVNLESLTEREFAISDPIAFIRRYDGQSVIIDEVQRVPDLLSQIQVEVDANSAPGRFILTGSQNFSMMQTVTQSLAGRTALCTLFPFALGEVQDKIAGQTLDETMWRGFYPKLYAQTLNPADELAFYVSTYLERDVREIENVRNLRAFSVFLRLAAGWTGQVLNVSSLAGDAGISPKVASDWLSLLESSYIVKLVEPWSANINKRLVKAPKLYFLDVGLASSLLGISSFEQLQAHPLRGALFETMVVDEFLKTRENVVGHYAINYYRDSNRNEIDLVIEDGGRVMLYEVKSGATYSPDWLATMKRLSSQFGSDTCLNVIYGGDTSQERKEFNLWSWRDLP